MASFMDTLNSAQDFINQNNPLDSDKRNQFKNDGFMLPSTFAADGNGLPYSKVPSYHQGQIKRNIITWFVPEFGTVKMYVNPESINYSHSKAINKERTKGGFNLQYWGENLSTLKIAGTTGSSGIEGINMLYEIYRAEQYAFDPAALTLAANNATADLSGNLINGLGGAIGGMMRGGDGQPIGSAAGSGLLGGIMGMNSPQNNLSAQNITSLAQLAFGVEMYYGGEVFRGYFESMSIAESANDFLFHYDIAFTVTQKRGYRTNYFPFHRTPTQGPSSYGTPLSFDPNNIVAPESNITKATSGFSVSQITKISK
jgi:hypothetical protein